MLPCSAVVAKLYTSQPVCPPPINQATVTGQSVEELRQLVMNQQQQMDALREEMIQQKQEMMEQLQQLLTKSFQQQENALAKKIETQRILQSCALDVYTQTRSQDPKVFTMTLIIRTLLVSFPSTVLEFTTVYSEDHWV